MKRKESWNNWQNQERKQFVYLVGKIESFSTHTLKKKKHIKVAKTKQRVASREHPSWLLLSFFVSKRFLHNEGGTCTEILLY